MNAEHRIVTMLYNVRVRNESCSCVKFASGASRVTLLIVTAVTC